jgi:hypothetical protein
VRLKRRRVEDIKGAESVGRPRPGKGGGRYGIECIEYLINGLIFGGRGQILSGGGSVNTGVQEKKKNLIFL